MNNEDFKERWDNYRKANSDKPLVRRNELSEVFNLLGPKPGEIILEVGTGNGYLTLPIADAVGAEGRLTTADVNQDNLDSVNAENLEKILFDDNILFSNIDDEKYDAIATIATLHHFDNKNDNTGESNRIKALKEFYRLLKPNGRLIIADVAENTISQKYFDAIDNPIHCFPEGHPYEFFTTDRLKDILLYIGFRKVDIEIKKVPWKFTSKDEAKHFINTLHNSKCTEDESLELADKYLGFKEVDGGYELGWELCFVRAEK